MPNAGMPKEVDNRRIYFCSPEYLTATPSVTSSLGAAAVGGCCGTTPEHIREVGLGDQAAGPARPARVLIQAAEAAEAETAGRVGREVAAGRAAGPCGNG